MINENEKKYIYIAFGIIGIILIIVLYFIWSPMFTGNSSFSKEITSMSVYTDNEYLEESSEKYKYIVKNIINIEKNSDYKEYLNDEYLNKYNITKDNAFEFLKNSNLLTHVSNTTVIYPCGVKQDSKMYVFSYKYIVNGNENMIHIIEDYYGNYTISFEQDEFPIINKDGFLVENNGLIFRINVFSSYEDTLILNFEVENSTTEEFTFKFNSLDASNLIYNGANIGYLSTAIVGDETSNIISKPGSVISFKLSYNIPLENQCDITEIDFNDVLRNSGEEQLISLFL